MSPPSRDEIRERVRLLIGGEYNVRWSDGRTTRGDFEGADWTLDVFDVPSTLSFDLGRRIGAYRRELRRTHGIGLVIVTHTPEATDRHFGWIRKSIAAGAEPEAPPVVTVVRASVIPHVRPAPRFEYGVRR